MTELRQESHWICSLAHISSDISGKRSPSTSAQPPTMAAMQCHHHKRLPMQQQACGCTSCQVAAFSHTPAARSSSGSTPVQAGEQLAQHLSGIVHVRQPKAAAGQRPQRLPQLRRRHRPATLQQHALGEKNTPETWYCYAKQVKSARNGGKPHWSTDQPRYKFSPGICMPLSTCDFGL